MDISLIQEKDKLDTYNLINIDEIEYQKCIKIILEISSVHELEECTFFHAVDIVKRYINTDLQIIFNSINCVIFFNLFILITATLSSIQLFYNIII